MTHEQGFSQMSVQASCGWPLSTENYFIFHMLPYKLLIRAGPIAHFQGSTLGKKPCGQLALGFQIESLAKVFQ